MWHKRRSSGGGGGGEDREAQKRSRQVAVRPTAAVGANLPFELFQSISAGLPLSDVLAWCQVNPGYTQFCDANTLWHDLLVRDFSALPSFPAAWLNPPPAALSDITAPRLWSEIYRATHEQKVLYEKQFEKTAQMVMKGMVDPFLVDLDPDSPADYALRVAPHFAFASLNTDVILTMDMNIDEHSERGLVMDIMYQGVGFEARERQEEEAKNPANRSLFDLGWYEWSPDPAPTLPRWVVPSVSSPFRSERQQPADVVGIHRFVLDSLRGFVRVLHLKQVNIRTTTTTSTQGQQGWRTLPTPLYGEVFSVPSARAAIAGNRYAAIARMP